MSCNDEILESEKTVHSALTKHAINTPHGFPQEGDSIVDVFFNLSQNLYPTGRAFRMKECSSFELLHKALNLSFGRVVRDAKETIESTFPDTTFFDIEDVNLWEYRLGLISNPDVPIQDRRDAILRKLSFLLLCLLL